MGYEGPDSYEELSKEPGLIITNDYQRQLQENPLSIGDEVPMAFYEKEYFPTQIIMYTLAGFIMVFGIINLVNTILSNLYARRKELGILQALGMTTGQLKRMIGRETLSYMGVSALCTLIFGSGLGYTLVMAQIQMGMNMIYAYPGRPVVLYLLAMFLIQWGFTDYGVKFLQKESFVERIKTL